VQASTRPGNGRGNALSTNAPPPSELLLSDYSWADEGAAVYVRVPLRIAAPGRGSAGRLAADSVVVTFAADAFDLRIHDDGGRLHRLLVKELPYGGVLPSARAPYGRLLGEHSPPPFRSAAIGWWQAAKRMCCSRWPRRDRTRSGLASARWRSERHAR
jgi:hypothetical protein